MNALLDCKVHTMGSLKAETWREKYDFGYLITAESVKIHKSNTTQVAYQNAVQYLAPATMAGGPNLCPCHTAGCFGEGGKNCIAGTGMLEMNPDVLIARSRFFFEQPSLYLERLIREVDHFVRSADRCGRQLVMRLNGTSDVDWERRGQAMEVMVDGRMMKLRFMDLFNMFPQVIWYDYTKVANRIVRDGRQIPLPPNYHLTFSLSEENEDQALQVIRHTDVNVAVVFDMRPPRDPDPGEPFPDGFTFLGRPVIDGDKHDLRFIDPPNSIVGLRLKTRGQDRRAQMVMLGFVIRDAVALERRAGHEPRAAGTERVGWRPCASS